MSILTSPASDASVFVPSWQQILPPTPELPKSNYEGTVSVNGIQIWHGQYGRLIRVALAGGEAPVIFLHGGHVSSRWWGDAISFLANKEYAIIAIDSRAHGRSSDDLKVPLSYDLYAKDAIAVMDQLKIPKASFVGWSDGGVTALDMAMNYPSRVDRIFAYGANSNPGQVNSNVDLLPYLIECLGRWKGEYEAISPTPGDFDLMNKRLNAAQKIYPDWTGKDFARIPDPYQDQDAPIIWIADGDHEELLHRNVAGDIRDMVGDIELNPPLSSY
jgi:pimeloyl-ACP methyl ester carboxylesterase